TALDAEPSVTVQPHPVSSLGLVASTPTSLQGGPDEQRPQELQLDHRALKLADAEPGSALMAVAYR
ncbi:MAG: hypothetical protein ABW135_03870, partial [Thermoleophilaceae bacterium]